MLLGSGSKKLIKLMAVMSAATILSACSALQGLARDSIKEPEVAYKSISIGDFSTQKLQLKPTFTITNKNGFTIPVEKLTYQLAFNQKTMVQGETDVIGDLPANKSKDVTLALDLSKDSLAAMQQVLFKQGKIDYLIQGTVEVMGFTFPFKQASTLYKPTAKLGKLEIKKASFKKLEMVVNLTVNNQNDFTLPLDMLSYAVSSGAHQLVAGDLKNQSIKQGSNQLQIPLIINPNKLFSSVFSLLQNPKLPLSFNFSSGAFESSVEQTLDLQSLFKSAGKDKSSKPNLGNVLQGLFN